jgi:glycosyltransferase involved in cell wall biosynthesis
MNCGVGDYTLELIKSLKGSFLEIVVITSDHEKIRQFLRDQNSWKVDVLPIIKKWDFKNSFLLIKKIKEFNPDIIHLQYHWWISKDGFIFKGLMFVFLPLMFKVFLIKSTVVTTLHSRLGGPYLFPKAGFLRRWLLLPLILFSDRIVVTNRFDGKKLLRWLPFLKKKVDYILGGSGHYRANKNLNTEAREIKLKLKSSGDEIILSNFGFMIPHKGLEELLEAMSILRNKGYPLKLLAIGGFDIEVNFSGLYFDRLQRMAETLKLGKHIKWTGFCDSKQASLFLLASDICVMPFPDGASEWRSSFLGALSHGLPIVSTFTEKTPEELVDRINCMLVPPKDSGRLASAIEELIYSPELRDSLGRAAEELFEQKYSWRVIAQKTMAVYESELNKSVNN